MKLTLTSEGKQKVKEALAKRTWTLEKLAEKSGLSRVTTMRFSSPQAIGEQSFKTLCETLGIKWRTVSEELTNPFMQRGMLDHLDDIYGRELQLQQVFEFLNSGASVALIGGAGMGTSSLLRAVEQRAAEALPNRQPIYFNMREMIDLPGYYAALADAMESESVEPFQVQREMRKHRLLLLLDEVEQLRENWFNDGVRRQLRAWANYGQNSPIRLVVAAHRPLTELFEDSGFDSPFANICHELELQPWDKETIEGFITHRLAGTEIQFTAEEMTKIVTQSQGIPSEVMKYCYDCYQAYRD